MPLELVWTFWRREFLASAGISTLGCPVHILVTNLTTLSLFSLNSTKNYLHRISYSLKLYYHTLYLDCTLSDASATSILQFKAYHMLALLMQDIKK
jgi:hypothetical protein